MKEKFILPQRAEKMSVEEQKEVEGGNCQPKGYKETKKIHDFFKKILRKR